MITHMTVSIEGLADRLLGRIPKKYGSWDVLQDAKTKRPLTKDEAWDVLREAKLKGYDVIPTCDNFDEKGHCKGHKSKAIA